MADITKTSFSPGGHFYPEVVENEENAPLRSRSKTGPSDRFRSSQRPKRALVPVRGREQAQDGGGLHYPLAVSLPTVIKTVI
jgi:hypothetical protein